ncbi:Hypp2351 [Branchiostoma lanceolatum]|uniref:Hypp2351 protein n=1 Tax=Branchiostoma lanceolatum TaxID=7740 RepID=A0A8K0ESQ7_BRALA|nr:Hypp2351 [Branchiostoma lanceolatum]
MRLVLWTVCLLLVSGWGALADEPDSPEDEFMFPSWDGDNRILNIGSKNFRKAVKDSEVLIVLFSADFDEHSEGDTQEEVSEYALQEQISAETAEGEGVQRNNKGASAQDEADHPRVDPTTWLVMMRNVTADDSGGTGSLPLRN